MKVLLATSEAVPYAKTGGLADVLGTLFVKLRRMSVDARLIMPLYRCVKKGFDLEPTGHKVSVSMGGDVYKGRILRHGKHALFIECNEFFDRKGLYGSSHGEYADNALRFIFFSRAVLEACKALDFMPDLFHCNDWHTGLIPLYLKSTYKDVFADSSSLFTIHNLGYQGIFPMSTMKATGLGMEMFSPDVMEFYGQINLMKAGIVSADAISTVSENYATEIIDKDHGFGLEGILRKRAPDISGIVNGIDFNEWDPATDGYLAANYSRADMSGKEKCKKALLRRCSLTGLRAPVLGMVGRLSSQKGVDVLLEAAEDMFEDGVNIVVLGEGDEELHVKLRELQGRYPDSFSLNIGFDNELAHQIFAGSDMLIMPSRYEPCGLTQMIAMRYGTVPVARATGGIVDTVEDYRPLSGQGTGFLFSDFSASAVLECVKRALCVYADNARWAKMVSRCMGKDFSWKSSVSKYISLYREIRGKVSG